MALEQVFECPQTLMKLRSAPLGEHLEGFCHWLLTQGFSRASVRAHLSNLSHFNEYLRSATEYHDTVTAKHVEEFIKAYPSQRRNHVPMEERLRRVRYSINRFTGYLSDKGLFDPMERVPSYQCLLEAYLEWLRDHQHAAPGTLKLRGHYLSRFLDWLTPQVTIEDLSKLTAERVEKFFIAYSQEMGRAARRSMQAALRTFFRFCLHEGYIRRRLDQAVPTLRTYKLSTVPRALSEAQAQKVLQTINRRRDAGRRDYAIIQLLYSFGVRGGQLRRLRLEDIYWADDQIVFRASKNGKDSLLPLVPEVGESLLDYLTNARPSCSYSQVFLTCRAPYHPLRRSSTVSEIVRRHIRAAGIDVPSKGAHVFRHGFATRMIRQGHSLKAIADVLGHRHLTTTFIYTKVDFNALTQVALDWPEEVSQ